MSKKSLAEAPGNLNILVTGGAGFIGSHTCVELLDAGYGVVVLDNLSNSREKSVQRIRQITKAEDDRLAFYQGDVRDHTMLEMVFETNDISAIIHFAGLKAVGESTRKPLEYYDNNIGSTLALCETARRYGVKNLVFSSSATVYGDPEKVPITEHTPKAQATNPYGRTKSMIEQILNDLYTSDPEWNIVLLRYFNPVGAHESGLIGEDPLGIPNNLMPFVAQVASGKLESIGVFGKDYPTPDGTGVRDYIHVVDLARGHVQALAWMGGLCGGDTTNDPYSVLGEPALDGTRSGVNTFNLGTGKGSSVLEVIAAFERACGRSLPYEIKPRRAGDIAENYATCEKARRELGWEARYDLDRMCEDSWRWQKANPQGYEE